MIRRICLVFVWSLLTVGCDDDQPQGPVDTGPTDARFDVHIRDSGPTPDLEPPIEGRVAIVSPAAGTTLTGADTLDGQANDGLRIEVVVEAVGADDDQVRVSVDGAAYVVDLIDARAAVQVDLPAEAQRSVRLRAEISNNGASLVDEIEVIVAVRAAVISVEPAPSGGCDFGSTADLDPDQGGVQQILTVTGDALDTLEVRGVGGPIRTLPVADPTVEVPITFFDGQTELRMVGRAADALDFEIGPLIYTARATPPGLVLNVQPARYGLADGETVGDRTVWTFVGQTLGLDPGTAVELAWDPPLTDAPARTIVDAEGRFAVSPSLGRQQWWSGTLTARAIDPCGVEARLERGLNLDTVVPLVRIVEPADGTRLTVLDDSDPERPDVQVAFTVEIDDPRPDVDYPLSVLCGPPGEQPRPRSLGPDDGSTRAASADAPVIGTVRLEERGEIECVIRAENVPNPAEAVPALYRLFFDQPVFEVAVPEPEGGCINDAIVTVQGLGQMLAGNDAQLAVIAVDPEGNRRDPVALDPLGDEVYRARLNAADLPDGAWTLRVEGSVFGGVPIEVFPAEIPIVVDRAPPTVEVIAPTTPHVSDIDPAAPGFQSAVIMRVCGGEGGALEVSSDAFIGEDRYAEAAVIAPGECADVALPSLTAPLGPFSLRGTARDTCGNTADFVVRTRVDPARISASIITPADGAGVDAALDGDPARDGCQIDLEGRVSGPGADARVVICTAGPGGVPDADCLAGSSAMDGVCAVTGVADAGTSLRCPLTLADGTHDLTLVAVGNARIESTPVRVRADCSPPAVQRLIIEEDRDDNGCVHRQERLNRADPVDGARVTTAFTVDGLNDGASVRLRSEGGLDLGVTDLAGGVGRIEATLPQGLHRLYLRGQDAVGNSLPEPGDAGVFLRPIEVDTRPPSPALIGLDDGICLSAADDVDLARDGLQLALRVETGRSPGESVSAALSVDGAEVQRDGGALDRVDFEPTLADGQRGLTMVVSDACGNRGSVAGFESSAGLPDWDRPRALSLRVDTVPPGLSVEGIDDGAVFTAADDAGGDPGDGFQIDALIAVDPAAPLEAGRAVEVWIDDALAVSDPNPLIVPDDFDGLLPMQLTTAAGPQTLQVRAVDACGNAGASAPLAFEVDIDGCASRFAGFAENPTVRSDPTPLDIEGAVELLDPRCAGARAALVIDGVAGPLTVVGDDGALRFAAVALEPGSHTLTLRIGPVDGVTLDSPAQQIIVDPLAPTVRITRPAGPDPAPLLTDDRPDLEGQQITLIAEVAEARVDTARRARLTIDGRPAGERAVEDGVAVAVEFADVTVAAGRQTIEVCVIDAAANIGCGRRVIEADPAPPGSVEPVEVRIVDPRETAVELRFTAPGDDGAVGTVSGYAVRRADAPFVDEADWAAAAASEVILPAAATAGEEEVLSIRGPGPTLIDGLRLNVLHALAIRALDDAGQPGPLVSVNVDLRLRMASGVVASRGGAWEGGDVINTTSPVIGAGDLDGDGYDDLLVAVSQSAAASGAALVFGGEDGFTTRALDPAPGMTDAFFGVVAAAAGDLNGDGAPDVAVQGYLEGFAGAAVALYFGCTEPCDRAGLSTADALIVTVGGRFTNSLAGVGDVWRPTGAGFDDLLVGGGLGGETDAFVVAGRADWPVPPATVAIGPGGDGADVARLITPEGPAGIYAAGLGDLDGDGFDDLALSAGGAIDASYVFYGGAWPGAVAFVADDPRTVRLSDPCPAANPSFGTAFVGGVDLDGDAGGRPDFAVGNRANKRVVVFDSDRATLDCFGRSPVQYGRFFDLAGDVDGDGAVDLVATHGDPAVSAAHIFFNDGLGRFGVGAMISPRGAHVTLDQPLRRKLGVAGAGDVDGDGRPDVAAVYLDGDAAMTWIVYY